MLDARRAALAVPIPGEVGAAEGFLVVPVYLAAIQLDLEDVALSRQLAGARTSVLVVDRSRHVVASVGDPAPSIGADASSHPVWGLLPDGTPTTHAIAKPVLALVDRARLIGQRDWARVKGDSGRGDEIGELDRAMVTMATR